MMNHNNKTPYILSENYEPPMYVSDHYDVIELSIEEMKGQPTHIRKKMKKMIGDLMRNCNRLGGRKIYPHCFENN